MFRNTKIKCNKRILLSGSDDIVYIVLLILFIISFIFVLSLNNWKVEGFTDLFATIMVSGIVAGVLFPLIGVPLLAVLEIIFS
jgi:hypothetical protein